MNGTGVSTATAYTAHREWASRPSREWSTASTIWRRGRKVILNVLDPSADVVPPMQTCEAKTDSRSASDPFETSFLLNPLNQHFGLGTLCCRSNGSAAAGFAGGGGGMP